MQETTMIFGAPGCGKTTYLLNLLSDILDDYDSDKIAFVSFTKKGSYEGRDRATEKFGYKDSDLPYFRTIHSLAFRDLGMSRYEMISKKNYKEFSRAMGMNFVGYYTEDFINNDDKYLFYVSLKKNNPRTAEILLEDLDVKKVNFVSNNYERFKTEMGVKDFDDLIVEFIKKDKPLPVQVAIIDEAQDLTSLQWKFCEVAFRNCNKVYIAGDDDQAIYEWSGSDIKHFLNLSKHSENIVLDKSYRLRQKILNFSKLFSKQISNRVDKIFDPVQEGGEIYFYNKVDEIPINNEESYYFLARNNYHLSIYGKRLRELGMTFQYKHRYSVDMKKYNAVRIYEKHRKYDPEQIYTDLSLKPYLRDIINIKDPWFYSLNFDINEKTYFKDLFKNKVDVTKTNCEVNTIHGVKGGEADNVVLLLDVTKTIDNNLERNVEALDSELRCLYVALTRAKKNLHIVHSNSQFGYESIFRRSMNE